MGVLGSFVLGTGLTDGLLAGLAGGFSGTERLSFSRSRSIFPAPGCLPRGLLDVPGNVGIDIPSQIILPRFLYVGEIIVCLVLNHNRRFFLHALVSLHIRPRQRMVLTAIFTGLGLEFLAQKNASGN